MSDDRARFWDERILDWEAARYDGRWWPSLAPIEWLAGALSGPTRRRQALGVELVAPFVKGRSVMEVGCGTGRLARRFLDAGARDYLGLDHSRVAIETARRRAGGEKRMRFEARSAVELPEKGDLIVSLGLIDWLTDAELRVFFRRHGAADFLHTFSERRSEPLQALHRLCRALDSRLRPGAVRPRFMTAAEAIASIPRNKSLILYRDRALRSAVFLSSLPLSAGARVDRAEVGS